MEKINQHGETAGLSSQDHSRHSSMKLLQRFSEERIIEKSRVPDVASLSKEDVPK